MHEPPDLLCSGCEFCGADDHIGCLGCSQMMAYRADTAQPLHQYRQLPVGPALDEFFEAAKFDNMQSCLLDVQVFILKQRDLAMPFDTS